MSRENYCRYMGRTLVKFSDWNYPNKNNLTEIQLRLRGFYPLEDPGAPTILAGERLEVKYKYLDKEGNEIKSLWFGSRGVADKLVVEYSVFRCEDTGETPSSVETKEVK